MQVSVSINTCIVFQNKEIGRTRLFMVVNDTVGSFYALYDDAYK